MDHSAAKPIQLLESNARSRWALIAIAALSCATVFSGCNRGPKMATVSGKVLYKDGTVPRGGVCVVNFNPTRDSTAAIKKAASGAIGPDGSFSLTTRMPNDGCYLGEYAVTFAVFPGPMDPRSLVLPKYTAPGLTPFKVNVEGNMSDLKFEIEPAPGVAGAAVSGAPAAAGDSKPAG